MDARTLAEYQLSLFLSRGVQDLALEEAGSASCCDRTVTVIVHHLSTEYAQLEIRVKYRDNPKTNIYFERIKPSFEQHAWSLIESLPRH